MQEYVAILCLESMDTLTILPRTGIYNQTEYENIIEEVKTWKSRLVWSKLISMPDGEIVREGWVQKVTER